LNRSEKPRFDPAASPKILLIRLRRIGDVVMTTPAVAAIKRALPGASISYVIEEPFRRLVEGNPHIDRVIAIPAKQGAADFVRFVRELRRETYDAVVDFHGGPRASRIAWLARGKFKVGYRLKYKGWIYDVRVPRTAAGAHIHSVENHLNLVRALGIEVEGPGTEPSQLAETAARTGETAQKEATGAERTVEGALRLKRRGLAKKTGQTETAPPLFLPEATQAEKDRVDRLWAENRLGAAKVVVLHVGAGNEFRDWGEDSLAALAARLAQKGGAAAASGAPTVRVLLVGAEGDKARARRIAVSGSLRSAAAAGAEGRAKDSAPGSAAPVVSLAGALNLIELREVISRTALFVGPDSGPMHIAATTRTPIVALFGPTLPDHFAPWRAEATIVARELACRPCKQRECVTRDFRCLRGITVDEVLAACHRYL
jgi:ADP-heptose:LPS heptosyltransferase